MIGRHHQAELRFLRSELLFRMAVQNAVIILNVVLFLATAVMQAMMFAPAAIIGLAYIAACLVLAAIWCHHGVRQAQIKTYILLSERDSASGATWETWLPANRVKGLLGARWIISAKLPFVATAAASCLFGLVLDPTPWGRPASAIGAIGIITLAVLLWTNPKEGLTPLDQQA